MKVFNLNSVRCLRKQKSVFCGLKSKIIISLSALLLVFINSFNISAQGLQELDQTLSVLKASTVTEDQVRYSNITNLVSGINPTVYINNGIIRTTSDLSPICVDVDMSSISVLFSPNSLYSQVEMLKIRIDSEVVSANVLNMNNLSSFSNLKYILFICSFNCDLRTIYSLYQPNTNGSISVFYQISIPN